MKWNLILAVLFAAAYVSAQSSSHNAVRLIEQATVRGDTVLLSDLLPPSADSALKVMAQQIILGRAPEPGSVRVFEAGDIQKLIASSAETGSIGITIPAAVIVRRSGWPLKVESVLQAVQQLPRAGRIEWSRARIIAPPEFTTLAPDPKLELLNVRRDGGGSGAGNALLVSLRCRERALCGSFQVEVLFSDAQGDLARGPKPASWSQKARPAAGLQSSAPELVRPGKIALLVIEENGVRISEPVMPSRRAGLGDVVQVSDPVTHRRLLARVTAAGMLDPADPVTRSLKGERP